MTPQQVKEKFRREGKTFRSWAKERGYRSHDVYLVLNGQRKGLWGRSHEIAVALGIKAAPEKEVPA